MVYLRLYVLCRTATFSRKQYFAKYRHRRVKLAPHCCSTLARSMVAWWGLIKKAKDRHGVFRVNNDRHPTLLARRRVAPRSREIGIKAATKRAASEALAQMSAMAAMPVIADIAFWWW